VSMFFVNRVISVHKFRTKYNVAFRSGPGIRITSCMPTGAMLGTIRFGTKPASEEINPHFYLGLASLMLSKSTYAPTIPRG